MTEQDVERLCLRQQEPCPVVTFAPGRFFRLVGWGRTLGSSETRVDKEQKRGSVRGGLIEFTVERRPDLRCIGWYRALRVWGFLKTRNDSPPAELCKLQTAASGLAEGETVGRFRV